MIPKIDRDGVRSIGAMGFLKRMWLNWRLLFAKRIVSVDYSNGVDYTCWCELQQVDGIIYITDIGVGNPPARKLNRRQVLCHTSE
jgi:hypothetical protein